MKKFHVSVGFFALCLAVSCRPIGPPDGHHRPTRRPVPATSPVVPTPAVPATPAVSPSVAELPPTSASSPATPTTAPTPNTPPVRPTTASRPALPPASKPATPKDPYLTAQKAPNKPGYALSPHTGKLVLIDGIPSGVVVPDQTCPPGEKKFFRVP